MSNQHVHDAEEARLLEAIYTTPSAVERRCLVRTHLDVTPGESVLSIGCGPGFEPAELANVVGKSGRVRGIDVSEPMLAMSKGRCANLPQVAIERGDASELPFPDDTFHAAVAVQVYEYLDNVNAAIAELKRILRPGGRAVVYSTDWDSLVWHSSNQHRLEQVIKVITDVYEHPHLGSQLASYLQDSGFEVDSVEPNSILNTCLENSFVGNMIDLVSVQMETKGQFDPSFIDAWRRDLMELDEAGKTFFSLTQYLHIIRNPK